MVFNSKYKERAFELQLWNIVHKMLDPIDDSGMLIKIHSYKVSQSFINNFGDLVSDLIVIFYYVNPDESRQMVKAINDQCFVSLKSLALAQCDGNSLDQLSNTFTNVKSFTFSTKKLDLQSDNKLNRIFPNVNALTVERTVASDWTFINGHFAHLIRFSVDFPENQSPDSVRELHIANFLRNNTQITDLSIAYSNLTLLKEVNTILTQMEHLTLNFLPKKFLDDQHQPVHFETVKHFTLNTNYGEIPEMTVFDQLEKLTIQSKSSTEWIKFISKQVNRNLSELNLFNDVRPEKLAIVPEKLPNLHVVHITCTWIIKAKQIVEFIENSNSLRHLRIVAVLYDDERKRLEETIPKLWIVQFYKPGYYEEIDLQRLD